MEDIGQGIIALINQIYNEMIPNVENISALIVTKINVVAAIGAILYIFGSLIKQIYFNEEINFLPYMRPFLILMLIPLSPIITEGIDKISDEIRNSVNGSNTEISKRIEKNSEYMQMAIKKKWDYIGNDEELYQKTFGNSRAEDDSGMFPIGDDIKLMMGRSTDEIKLALVLLIQNLLVTLMYIAEAALLLMSLCYRLILKMGFPIVITLTIFPGFTNNLINWFGKYINFSLLPAVAAMYSSIAFALLDLYLQTDPTGVTPGSETQNPEFLGFAYIGILVLSLVGYIFVPSMTAMLVNIGGVGAIMGGSTRAVSQSVATASRGGTNAANKLNSLSNRATSGARNGAVKGAALAASTVGMSNQSNVAKTAFTAMGAMGGAAVGAVAGIKKKGVANGSGSTTALAMSGLAAFGAMKASNGTINVNKGTPVASPSVTTTNSNVSAPAAGTFAKANKPIVSATSTSKAGVATGSFAKKSLVHNVASASGKHSKDATSKETKGKSTSLKKPIVKSLQKKPNSKK